MVRDESLRAVETKPALGSGLAGRKLNEVSLESSLSLSIDTTGPRPAVLASFLPIDECN